MKKLELRIRNVRYREDHIEFLFYEEDSTAEIRKKVFKRTKEKTYDLRINRDKFADVAMKDGPGLGLKLMSRGPDSLEGMKTFWELDGDEYKMVKIQEVKGKSKKRSSDPEVSITEVGMDDLPEELREKLFKKIGGIMERKHGSRKVEEYEYDEIVATKGVLTVGDLNEKGRKGWFVIDMYREEGEIKRVFMGRKVK